LPRQTTASAVNNRCSGAWPFTSCNGSPALRRRSSAICRPSNATATPPKSLMFSPSIGWPLMRTPGSGS
jgi:hypothetical protein